jgi:putative copper resistance protein D
MFGGTLTEPLTWVRAVHYASMVQLVGVFAFLYFVAEPAVGRVQEPDPSAFSRLRVRLIRLAWLSLATGFVSGALWLLFVAAEMSGQPLGRLLSDNIIVTVLTRTQFGRDWQLRFVLAVVLIVCLVGLGADRRGARAVVRQTVGLLLSAGGLATLAWAGHARGTAGLAGSVHLSSDVIHLLAAGTWLGSLVPLALLFSQLRADRDLAWAAVAGSAALRFSALGIVSVAALLLTGIVNAWFLLGSIPKLVGTDYGRVLLVKVGLFTAMVGIAAINRFRLTPRLVARSNDETKTGIAVCHLQRNCLIEASLGFLILVIVGALGIMMPAMHSML